MRLPFQLTVSFVFTIVVVVGNLVDRCIDCYIALPLQSISGCKPLDCAVLMFVFLVKRSPLFLLSGKLLAFRALIHTNAMFSNISYQLYIKLPFMDILIKPLLGVRFII